MLKTCCVWNAPVVAEINVLLILQGFFNNVLLTSFPSIVSSCENIKSVTAMVTSLVITKNDLEQCTDVVRKYICLKNHKICLLSNRNGTIKSLKSPICRESCENIMLVKVCAPVKQVIDTLSKIRQMCPKMKYGQNIKDEFCE